jgi:chemotaxis-related protein WspB
MLVLTFQIGSARLAMDLRSVREVVPRVRLRQPGGCPPWLAGMFVYRGQVVPVIDVHQLAGAGECPPHLSSRIILVPNPAARGEALLGLLAAQVADIRDIRPAPGTLLRLASPAAIDFGPVMADGDGFVHLLELNRLLPDTVRGHLAEVAGELPV